MQGEKSLAFVIINGVKYDKYLLRINFPKSNEKLFITNIVDFNLFVTKIIDFLYITHIINLFQPLIYKLFSTVGLISKDSIFKQVSADCSGRGWKWTWKAVTIVFMLRHASELLNSDMSRNNYNGVYAIAHIATADVK